MLIFNGNGNDVHLHICQNIFFNLPNFFLRFTAQNLCLRKLSCVLTLTMLSVLTNDQGRDIHVAKFRLIFSPAIPEMATGGICDRAEVQFPCIAAGFSRDL